MSQIYLDIGIASTALKPQEERTLGSKTSIPEDAQPIGRIVLGGMYLDQATGLMMSVTTCTEHLVRCCCLWMISATAVQLPNLCNCASRTSKLAAHIMHASRTMHSIMGHAQPAQPLGANRACRAAPQACTATTCQSQCAT